MIIIPENFIPMNSPISQSEALASLLRLSGSPSQRQPIAVLCHTDTCCPVIALDESAPEAQQVVISDDFGQEIQMSRGQFQVLLDLAKSGAIKI